MVPPAIARSPHVPDVSGGVLRLQAFTITWMGVGSVVSLVPMASGPFAVCNCSAAVETLFESELLG